MSEEEGTRRWPRDSKYARNRSRTSADVHVFVVMRAFHHGRDRPRREAPAGERRAHAAPACGRLETRRPPPKRPERARESFFFHLAGFSEGRGRDLLREPERGQLPGA